MKYWKYFRRVSAILCAMWVSHIRCGSVGIVILPSVIKNVINFFRRYRRFINLFYEHQSSRRKSAPHLTACARAVQRQCENSRAESVDTRGYVHLWLILGAHELCPGAMCEKFDECVVATFIT